MKLSLLSESPWVGKRIRDRVHRKSGVVKLYNLENDSVTIAFDDGEERTIPHHRKPNEDQPHGAFYTNRYWDGPVK